MSFVSCYDETCSSRTRLENANGDIVCSFGCFRGEAWFHSDELGAFLVKQVFDDPNDQMIGTAMLIKVRNCVFAFLGFLRGGTDSFHAWTIDESTTEIYPLATESRLKGFGAAHAYTSEMGDLRSISVACGLGLKTVRIFSLTQTGTSEPFTITYKATVNCRASVSALAFDKEGNKLVALSGEDGDKDVHVFVIPENLREDDKYKFIATNFSKVDFLLIMGCTRLAESFLHRESAFRNPKARNDELDKWRTVFSSAGFLETTQSEITAPADDEKSDAYISSAESDESTESQRKRSRIGDDKRGPRRGLGKKPRARHESKICDEETLQDLRQFLDGQKQLRNENRELKQNQDKILGMLAILKSEQAKILGLLRRRDESEESKPAMIPHVLSPLQGMDQSPFYGGDGLFNTEASSPALAFMEACASSPLLGKAHNLVFEPSSESARAET